MKRFKQFLTEAQSNLPPSIQADIDAFIRILQECECTLDSATLSFFPHRVYCEYDHKIKCPFGDADFGDPVRMVSKSQPVVSQLNGAIKIQFYNIINDDKRLPITPGWNGAMGTEPEEHWYELVNTWCTEVFGPRFGSVDDMIMAVTLRPNTKGAINIDNWLPAYQFKRVPTAEPPKGYTDPFEQESQ